MIWTSERVARVLGTAARLARRFATVSTDTRTLEDGALFVALVGERFDGHDYLADAEARGAAGAVVRRGTGAVGGLATFEVEDTLAALGALARERRRAVEGPVVAVTGTNGKTAVKEMLARALGTQWRVHATHGNLNNLVGVPLTVLSAPGDTDALVLEAGASVPGEIRCLRDIIEPTVGVVTNVSGAHLEGFGSLEGVLQEKLALLESVPLAVVGSEPPELARRAREAAGRVVVAGRADAADARPEAWGLDETGRAELTFGGVPVRLPLVGAHQVENAMLALAVAAELGLELSTVARALDQLTLPPGRCEVLRDGDLVVLHDAYNANPASIAASLETARVMRGERPLVVVLGTMLELGDQSEVLHESTADGVMAAGPALVGAVGAFVPAFERHRATLGDRLLTASDPATLGGLLAPRLDGREFVLLKASRGVRMERVIPFLISNSE